MAKKKTPRPALTEAEQARVNALRQARKGRKTGRRGTAARTVAAKATYAAQQERQQQEASQQQRERATVEAKAGAHIARLRANGHGHAPWDPDFVTDLQALLARGQTKRALAVATAVTTQIVAWNAPEDTLTQRLAAASEPTVVDARTNSQFSAFVRRPLSTAHRRWATSRARVEAARHPSATPPSNDADLERERGEATARRRPISKRY